MRIKGERRIGKTIRKLSNSVELSNKESLAKAAEERTKRAGTTGSAVTDDSPIQNLQELASRRKKETRQ